MGPIILFDKSFIQSLSVDESVFFDHFFYPAVCPLFFSETLADLEKAVRQGRTPEDEVGIIAAKVPEMSGAPLLHHTNLALMNLLGHEIPMNGRIPTAGGVVVQFEGKTGVRHDVPEESRAFERWQKREFLELERLYAKAWRESLAAIDLLAVAAGMQALGINAKICKSLEDAKRITDSLLERTEGVENLIKLALIVLGIHTSYESPILDAWREKGSRPLSEFAAYAAHVLSIELFFQIALAADLIGTARSSNRIDISYLFYLPFCQAFVSSDDLHRRCALLFLRTDQSFVWGPDLKADLRRAEEHYGKLPDEEKELGLMAIARTPKGLTGSLISDLWDRHLRPIWRDQPSKAKPRDDAEAAKLIAYLDKFSEAPTIPRDRVPSGPMDADMAQITRNVHVKKGSWFQLPKKIADKK